MKKYNMKRMIDKIFASKLWWLPLLVVLFGINYLASVFHARLDLTKREKVHTQQSDKRPVEEFG